MAGPFRYEILQAYPAGGSLRRLHLTDEALMSWRPPKAVPRPHGQGMSAEWTNSMIGTQPRATLFASGVDRDVEECKGVSTNLLRDSPAALGLDIRCLFGADEERQC